MTEPTKYNFGDQKIYYANARLGGKTALLAGPFITANEAEATLDIVGPAFINEEPLAVSASFGVMQCNIPGPCSGRYNHLLPPELYQNLAIGVPLN